MSKNDKIVIGIIGAGGNTQRRHIPGFRKISDVRIKSVCNRTIDSSRRIALETGIPNPVEKPEAIFTDPEIDAVLIGTWPYRHRDFTIGSLESGKHVLCEARMAMNAQEAQEMVQVSKTHPNLIAQIVPAPMTLAQDDTVQSLIKKLGQITAVSAVLTGNGFPSLQKPLTWRRDKKFSGNNLMSVGIAYEIILRWLGPVSRIFADTRIIQKTAKDPETGKAIPVHVPDYAVILGTLIKDNAAFCMYSHQPSGIPKENEIYICGFRGVIKVVPGRSIMLRTPDKPEFKSISFPEGDGWQVEEEFINAIRGIGKIKKTDFYTGLQYMQFTDAVHRSSEKGSWVAIS
jgi:predicted dehydrogenase